MPSQPVPAGEYTIDVAIVCALELESDPLIKRLRGHRRTMANQFVLDTGAWGGRRVAVVRAGTNPKRIATVVDALRFTHRPRWLVSAGFAVGLSDGLRTGDALLATEQIDDEGDRLVIELGSSVVDTLGPAAHTGRLLSTARWPLRAAEKRELFERTGALAADHQSFALARLCAGTSMRFVAVRILIDDASTDAGSLWRAVYHPSTSFRAGATVGAFLSGSGRVGKIWKLRAEAKRHAERLAGMLQQILPSLP